MASNPRKLPFDEMASLKSKVILSRRRFTIADILAVHVVCNSSSISLCHWTSSSKHSRLKGSNWKFSAMSRKVKLICTCLMWALIVSSNAWRKFVDCFAGPLSKNQIFLNQNSLYRVVYVPCSKYDIVLKSQISGVTVYWVFLSEGYDVEWKFYFHEKPSPKAVLGDQ